MKRLAIIFMAVSLVLSCADEIDEVIVGSRFDCFLASVEDNTKTVLNSNMTIGWEKGDEVAVNDGTETWKFVAAPSAASNRNATLSPAGDEKPSLTEGHTYYALYPYEENAVWEGSKVTFKTPSTIAPKAGTFPYNPSVSSTTTSSIKFRNICSLIKFSLVSDNVSKIVFMGSAGEYLVGEITVDCTEPEPEAVVTDGKGMTSIVMEGDFAAGTDYYVTVLPNDFVMGMTVMLYNEEGEVMTRVSNPFEMSRSSIVEFGAIDEDKTWESTDHPVLFFDQEEGQRIKADIHGKLSSLWQRVIKTADNYAGTNPPAFKNDVGEQLWQRTVGSVISHLAFAGYISGEQKYMDAAFRWAEASCSYPTWGTDDTEDGQEFGLPYGHQLLGLSMLYDYGQEFLTEEQLSVIKATLLSRTRRQYDAYIKETLNLITNHCWINLCGMLASAMVLKGEEVEVQAWMDFALSRIEATSTLLIPDGVSQEGPNYWRYGMEYLIIDYELAKSLGRDLYKNSPFWKHTAKYSKYFTLPLDHCSVDANIINWGDSKHSAGVGPAHLYYKLASLNQDSVIQYWADESLIYDSADTWLNILWYDNSISAVCPEKYPSSYHFEEMDIWASRTGWDGNEAVVIYRAGAPLGKSVMSTSDYEKGNLGHCHPDAGHFCIYDDGEYIIRNTGYVQRLTKYHNVALFNGCGLWGEQKTWFSPYPLTPERYAAITHISTDEDMDVVMSDMSETYKDAACIESYTRKFIWMKKQNAVIIIDDIDCFAATDVQLNFYPESQAGTCEGRVYASITDRHKIRIENLSPSETSVLEQGIQLVANRRDDTLEEMNLITIKDRLSEDMGFSGKYITAISWSVIGVEPAIVSYDATTGELSVVGGEDKDLSYRDSTHEGFGTKDDFSWKEG